MALPLFHSTRKYFRVKELIEKISIVLQAVSDLICEISVPHLTEFDTRYKRRCVFHTHPLTTNTFNLAIF